MFDSGYAKIAYDIASEVHKNQVDRAGRPYIEHPVYLAQLFEDDKLQAVALLHDVLEDSELSLEDLIRAGIPEDVAEAVALLTHKDDGLTYMEYIEKIQDSGNELAIKVKKEDLKHNMDVSRLSKVTDQDKSRLRRYERAMDILER